MLSCFSCWSFSWCRFSELILSLKRSASLTRVSAVNVALMDVRLSMMPFCFSAWSRKPAWSSCSFWSHWVFSFLNSALSWTYTAIFSSSSLDCFLKSSTWEVWLSNCCLTNWCVFWKFWSCICSELISWVFEFMTSSYFWMIEGSWDLWGDWALLSSLSFSKSRTWASCSYALIAAISWVFFTKASWWLFSMVSMSTRTSAGFAGASCAATGTSASLFPLSFSLAVYSVSSASCSFRLLFSVLVISLSFLSWISCFFNSSTCCIKSLSFFTRAW